MSQHTQTHTDLLVIGGGINGAGIALDAIGRGLSVRLVEQNDFASATSSASSKLIHGGLRYLEYYEFRLVREALAERETLFKKAPHLVKPMRFILPHRPHLRPAWMIRAGLFLYDTIGGKSSLEKSKGITFGPDAPTKNELKKGFEYTDCWVDDARLVILNLIDLSRRGGHVHNYSECETAKIVDGKWQASVKDKRSGITSTYTADTLVNAAGPWAQSFIEEKMQLKSPRRMRLIKGSHLIMPKAYEGDKCYILQNEDKRIVFVIPYLNDFTIIGTTDKEHKGEPDRVEIDPQETEYLLKVYNDQFKKQFSQDDIVSSWSGVRPLCDDESDDPSAITRDYTLTLEKINNQAPLLSIFGGKLTTYRKLAEAAMRELEPCIPNLGEPWTKTPSLPGGELDLKTIVAEMAVNCSFIPIATRDRWASSYGTLYKDILKEAKSLAEMGQDFGGGLTQNEVDYLVEKEWALTSEDILMRRTKLHLSVPKDTKTKLDAYLGTVAKGSTSAVQET